MSIIKKIRKLRKLKINELIRFHRKYRKLNLSFIDLIRLKTSNNRKETNLFGKTLKITDSFWYIHTLDELFIDEVYRFKTSNFEPIIIDCGSNVGLSILYFKRLYPNSKIIGYEPDNDIFELLRKNIDTFELKDVQIHQKAVWINEEPLTFFKEGTLGGHLIDNESTANDKILIVPTIRLKSLLKEKIDFLKIDIEGSEYTVLHDCKEELINVENLFVEYHSESGKEQYLPELLLILKNAGFKLYIREEWENMKYPFVEKKSPYFDMQLNIFCYRD